MASLRGRYFSARDINFINSINAELMGDIIETLVTVFKIAASETKVNMYGESAPSEGKTFYPGIDISCLIEKDLDRIVIKRWCSSLEKRCVNR